MQTITLDRYDLLLLDALQRDGNATHTALGAVVNLSAWQISRRVQRLNGAGLVAGYAALLDPMAIGLGVTAFASVIVNAMMTRYMPAMYFQMNNGDSYE